MSLIRSHPNLFENLPGYSFQPNFVEVNDVALFDDSEVFMHYVDYGDKDAPIVMMLHGEPSWSYLYRHMIDEVKQANYRAIAPDLIGFGKSDKYDTQDAYTYANHIAWLTRFIDKTKLSNIHLFCQDWGGLLGLRLVANHPELFASVVVSNTMLPTGDYAPSQAFLDWRHYSQNTDNFDIASIIQKGTQRELITEIVNAYNAPFPEEKLKAGARKFPLLVPITPDDTESENNRQAWSVLAKFDKPFLTLFSDSDPITRGGEKIFQKLVIGCQDQPHELIKDGGHFLQEDCYEVLSKKYILFLNGVTRG